MYGAMISATIVVKVCKQREIDLRFHENGVGGPQRTVQKTLVLISLEQRSSLSRKKEGCAWSLRAVKPWNICIVRSF